MKHDINNGDFIFLYTIILFLITYCCFFLSEINWNSPPPIFILMPDLQNSSNCQIFANILRLNDNSLYFLNIHFQLLFNFINFCNYALILNYNLILLFLYLNIFFLHFWQIMITLKLMEGPSDNIFRISVLHSDWIQKHIII